MNNLLEHEESNSFGIKTKEDLDKSISQLIEGATNKETPREFIASSEEEFGMRHADLDNMSIKEINAHIEFLDYLWTK